MNTSLLDSTRNQLPITTQAGLGKTTSLPVTIP
ncbi:unnamed protein product, partial [marine sediment metagenome]